MKCEIELYFLLYESRSGSTFLSNSLEQYDDIGVMIEADLIRTILFYENELLAQKTLSGVLKILSVNSRFDNLDLDARDLSKYLDMESGFTAITIIEGIVCAYFAKVKPGIKTGIIKEGANGFRVYKLSQMFPAAKFIHIIRDGRAVYNSKMKTLKPYGNGKYMARDPITTAKLWKKMVGILDQFNEKYPDKIINVYYESLLLDKDTQLSLVRCFMGLPVDVALTKRQYVDDMPDAEKKIHTLVGKQAVHERISAWKKELSVSDIIVYQFFTSSSLVKHGYEEYIFESGKSFAVYIRIIQTVLKSYYLIAKDRALMLFNPMKLFRRMKEKILL